MSLTDAFLSQAVSCRALGSPFMHRLMTLMAARLTAHHGSVAARLFAWPGDVTSSGHSLPLRLAGGLHALRLQGNAVLTSVYPPNIASDDDLWAAVSDVMVTEADFLGTWIDLPPQTNELRRSVVLRATGQWLTAQTDLPLDLCELGASAGLNLNWDRYALDLGTAHGPADAAIRFAPDWDGPEPPSVAPAIASRRGVDLNPLDPTRDRLRLLAYLWPDQPERMARMERACDLPPAQVDHGDAADWLEALPPLRDGQCRMIFHTVAWQYFPAEIQARARAAIEAMGRTARATSPLAWFGMEADGRGPGAGLTLRTWPDGQEREAGRVDFHGRWVRWNMT
ncbi:MAG: DUF2332 family protein [Pseudomonadota bacterium]